MHNKALRSFPVQPRLKRRYIPIAVLNALIPRSLSVHVGGSYFYIDAVKIEFDPLGYSHQVPEYLVLAKKDCNFLPMHFVPDDNRIYCV